MDSDTKVDLLTSLIDREKSIRFSSSDIAAIAGYHPYANISELFEKYLYQDLDLLRQLDCKKLGIQLISADDQIDEILAKLSERHRDEFHRIQSASSSKDVLKSNADAQGLLKTISSMINSEDIQKSISKEESYFLEKELEGKVKTQYGIFSEDSALDKYEDLTGYKVVERNEATNYMEIPALVVDLSNNDDDTNIMQANESSTEACGSIDIVCVPPHGNLSTIEKIVEIDKETPPSIDATSILMAAARRKISPNPPTSTVSAKRKSITSTSQGSCVEDTKKRRKLKPAFYLVGKVDGISYQLDVSSNDATKWKPTKVVVEVKSRVFRVKDPPPLYEQIQLVSYMIMLNCAYGDLVQAVRLPSSTASINTIVVDAATTSEAKQYELTTVIGVTSVETETSLRTVKSVPDVEMEYKISRVALNTAPYYHQFHWDTVIIPRLHVFRDSIMALRKDDDLRASFLLADEDARIALIQHLCPYFTN